MSLWELYSVLEFNMYSSAVFKYKFEVLLPYLNISILSSFILLLYYSSEANNVLLTPLHLSNRISYKLLFDITIFHFMSREKHVSQTFLIH